MFAANSETLRSASRQFAEPTATKRFSQIDS